MSPWITSSLSNSDLGVDDGCTYVYPDSTAASTNDYYTIPPTQIFNGYITITYPAYSQVSIDGDGMTIIPETEEQKQARLKEMERIKAEQEQVKQKADELLKSHIGPEAFGKLHEVGYIELDSQKYQGRKYRVPKHARNLIEVFENGKVIDRLCVHPARCFPEGDEILTRLVLLECAEELLLNAANHNMLVGG